MLSVVFLSARQESTAMCKSATEFCKLFDGKPEAALREFVGRAAGAEYSGFIAVFQVFRLSCRYKFYGCEILSKNLRQNVRYSAKY
jgi:hypothetical protein